MQKILIILGVSFLLIGLFYPLIVKIGIGNLPGDLRIERDNFTIYLPITTCVVVSVFISLIIRFFK
ncbi:MAG TPA: DUF2905 domain-containing protein [Gammaproteobacteria bacterium]|nr:DUF2905 domain-containing protein [Gammaproteobacteria bacterium]